MALKLHLRETPAEICDRNFLIREMFASTRTVLRYRGRDRSAPSGLGGAQQERHPGKPGGMGSEEFTGFRQPAPVAAKC